MRLWYFLLLLVTLLPGCSQLKPGGTTIPKALSGLQSDIAFSGAMGVTGSLNWASQETAAFNASVKASQCQQKKADPVVVSMIGDMSMTLSGAYSASGQFTVGSVTTAPALGITGSTSHTIGQSLTLPVTFVTLSSLPDAVLLRRLTLVKGTFNENVPLSTAALTQLVKSYWDERDDLVTRIRYLVETWTPSQCTQTDPTVLFGTHHD